MSAVTQSALRPQPAPGDPAAAWRGLVADASVGYRPAGRFAWKAASGKLRFDPVFRHILRAGLIPPNARLLDIGCGRGLLLSLLQAAGRSAARGGWPADWPAAPVGVRLTGIERMAGDARLAQAALGAQATIIRGDMVDTPLPAADVVAILDVLHYVDIDAQDRLLARVRHALAPGGRLLLRVGDAARTRGFRRSQWIDRIVLMARGQPRLPMAGRPLAAWLERLSALGFSVESRPMSQGTPFSNQLLVATAIEAVGQPAPTR